MDSRSGLSTIHGLPLENRVLLFARLKASSETPGHSAGSGEKARWKFSSTGERTPGCPLSPSYFQKFMRMPAPDWAQKMLCIIVPNRRTVSPEFFSWVRTWQLLFRSRLVWLMQQRNARVRKRSVWYKIPIWFQNTVCPKTKDAFSKNTSLSLQQVFTLASVTSCVNIREFLKDTTTADNHGNVAWKKEFTFFQFLSNSLTLSNASELFWSWISINHIQVHEENEFCHCLFTSFTKREIRHFHG